MSADNCIAIGRFLKDDQYTYRVIHAQAIENCDANDEWETEFINANRVLYFGNSNVFTNEDTAFMEAKRIYAEIMESDFPIIEYGILRLTYDVPFPEMSIDEANIVIANFWKKYQESKGFNIS